MPKNASLVPTGTEKGG